MSESVQRVSVTPLVSTQVNVEVNTGKSCDSVKLVDTKFVIHWNPFAEFGADQSAATRPNVKAWGNAPGSWQ